MYKWTIIHKKLQKSSDLCYNNHRPWIYSIFYILYRTGTILFDMNTIILMFGFGMVVHYIVSLIEEKVFFRNKEGA